MFCLYHDAATRTVTGLNASPLELTILVSAFPVGVFFGPLWADLGRRWGMQKLVTQMAIWANVPLFLIYWVEDAPLFTALKASSDSIRKLKATPRDSSGVMLLMPSCGTGMG